MASRWFQHWGRHAFLADVATFDAAIADTTQRLRQLRGEMLALYEELEMGIRAMDLLAERAEEARGRVKDRLTRPGAPEPAVFSRELRQRSQGVID